MSSHPPIHEIRIELLDSGPGSVPPHKQLCVARWDNGAGGGRESFELDGLLSDDELQTLAVIRQRIYEELDG